MSTVRAVRAALPHLLERGRAIVNVPSTHAHVPSAVNVDDGAAKAGIDNLTQTLSEEFGPRGRRDDVADHRTARRARRDRGLVVDGGLRKAV